MARTARDAKLDSRAARSKLGVHHEPYWRSIDAGMHIGYRKGRQKSSWVARYFTKEQAYRKSVLGLADDTQDADGMEIFSFSQAQEAARAWFREQARLDRGEGEDTDYTVSKAIDDYVAEYRARGGKSLADVKGRTQAFIRPRLGDTKVADLTRAAIRNWHRHLASEPPRARSKRPV